MKVKNDISLLLLGMSRSDIWIGSAADISKKMHINIGSACTGKSRSGLPIQFVFKTPVRVFERTNVGNPFQFFQLSPQIRSALFSTPSAHCVCGNLTIFYSGFVCVAFIYNVILFTILFTLLLFKNRALMPIQCVW